MIVRVSDKFFDIKTLSKSCLAYPKPITLGFVVHMSQILEGPYNDNCANWCA